MCRRFSLERAHLVREKQPFFGQNYGLWDDMLIDNGFGTFEIKKFIRLILKKNKVLNKIYKNSFITVIKLFIPKKQKLKF